MRYKKIKGQWKPVPGDQIPQFCGYEAKFIATEFDSDTGSHPFMAIRSLRNVNLEKDSKGIQEVHAQVRSQNLEGEHHLHLMVNWIVSFQGRKAGWAGLEDFT